MPRILIRFATNKLVVLANQTTVRIAFLRVATPQVGVRRHRQPHTPKLLKCGTSARGHTFYIPFSQSGHVQWSMLRSSTCGGAAVADSTNPFKTLAIRHPYY